MQQLSDRLYQLCVTLLVASTVALQLGLPAKWVGIISFVVLDLVGILWGSQDTPANGSRSRQTSRRKHQHVMANAAA
jgi:hypothetical protein